MDFLPEELDNYVVAHSEQEPTLLYDLNRQTHLKVLQPRMLSGHYQGRVLSMLSKMIQPKRVLEIGTYTGYSALCFAEGLQSGGKITTIDVNHLLEEMVCDYIDKAELKDTIEYTIGDAMEIIPELDEVFDLVFIDADKTNYVNYYKLVIDKVPSGGYIIADNVLWSGKVLKPIEALDEDTKVLVEFNALVQADDRVENVLFPIRDGLMVIRKK